MSRVHINRPAQGSPGEYEQAVLFFSDNPPTHLEELTNVRRTNAQVSVHHQSDTAQACSPNTYVMSVARRGHILYCVSFLT